MKRYRKQRLCGSAVYAMITSPYLISQQARNASSARNILQYKILPNARKIGLKFPAKSTLNEHGTCAIEIAKNSQT